MRPWKWCVSFILEEIIKIFWLLPIDKKKILFFSFEGKQFSDSPKYLSEFIKQNYADYKIYWAFIDLKKFKFLKGKYRTIGYKSISFIFHFITAKIIITNDSVRPFLPVRKKQIFLNTWHGGTPLKTCGLAEASPPADVLKVLKHYEKKYTAYLSSSKFITEEVFRKSFNYHGAILEFGMPRNAILLREHKEIKNKVYRYFDINMNKRLVLYAPTFRDGTNSASFLSDNMKLDVSSCLDSLEKRFGGSFCFLFRAHHAMADKHYDDRFLSATGYPDMQELLCAADVLITDYSSCMGDMALMYKPVFLYVPDLMSYIKNRGFYWDIHSLPFPLAGTNLDLSDVILHFDVQKYKRDVDVYFEKLGSFESVDSIEKTCRWLFQKVNE